MNIKSITLGMVIMACAFTVTQFQNCAKSEDKAASVAPDKDPGTTDCENTIEGCETEADIAGSLAPPCPSTDQIVTPDNMKSKTFVCQCYTSPADRRFPKPEQNSFYTNAGGFVSNGYGCIPYTKNSDMLWMLDADLNNYKGGIDAFCASNSGEQYSTHCQITTLALGGIPIPGNVEGCNFEPETNTCP